MPRLENWSTTTARTNDPYLPPEMRGIALQGEVFGHRSSRFKDGHRVITSPIRIVNGTTITTISGSVYELGTPDPKFLEWLASEGRTFDPAHPITLKG